MAKKSGRKAGLSRIDAQSLLGRIVSLSWVDSAREEGWTRDAPEFGSVFRCQSVGKVYAVNDDSIMLIGHWTEEDRPQRCGGMTIPRVAVVSVRVLE